MMMMIVEQSVECELEGETEVSEKSFPSATLSTTKFHMISPGLEPGPPRLEAGD
jgi:hypothetical protein